MTKTQRKQHEATRDHLCPHCKAEHEAPVSVLAHPRSIYTVTCDVCSEKYQYCYITQEGF
jgi:transcription elongation factor Elf1